MTGGAFRPLMENAPGKIVLPPVSSRVSHALLTLKMSEGENGALVLFLWCKSSQVAFAIVDGARAGADDSKHAALVLVSSSNLSPVFVVVDGARAGADNNSDDDDKSEGNHAACVLVLSRDLSTVFVIVDGARAGAGKSFDDDGNSEGEGAALALLLPAGSNLSAP